jgi:hypothetical protein
LRLKRFGQIKTNEPTPFTCSDNRENEAANGNQIYLSKAGQKDDPRCRVKLCQDQARDGWACGQVFKKGEMNHRDFLMKLQIAKELSPTNGTKRNYYNRHKTDPQCPWLGDVRHRLLMDSRNVVKFDTEQSMRVSMIKTFGAVPGANSRRWVVGISKTKARRLMQATGMRWFELDGTPYIHWNEKETASV